MMSDDPQNRSVYSDSEVSKEDILWRRVRNHFLRLERGLAAWLNVVHLNLNLSVAVAITFWSALVGLQGLRGDEEDVGFSEDGVNDDNERKDEEEEEGVGEIQNFPCQEKIIPMKVFPQNLEMKDNINQLKYDKAEGRLSRPCR